MDILNNIDFIEHNNIINTHPIIVNCLEAGGTEQVIHEVSPPVDHNGPAPTRPPESDLESLLEQLNKSGNNDPKEHHDMLEILEQQDRTHAEPEQHAD